MLAEGFGLAYLRLLVLGVEHSLALTLRVVTDVRRGDGLLHVLDELGIK